jgi:hypothetical protein
LSDIIAECGCHVKGVEENAECGMRTTGEGLNHQDTKNTKVFIVRYHRGDREGYWWDLSMEHLSLATDPLIQLMKP